MPKFVLQGNLKGQTVSLAKGRYNFVNGELSCSEQDAERMSWILVSYYGATLEQDDDLQVTQTISTTTKPNTGKTGQPAVVNSKSNTVA